MPELSQKDIDRLNLVGKKIQSMSGPGVVNSGDAIVIQPPPVPPPPAPQDKWKWVTLTSFDDLGTGIYSGTVMKPLAGTLEQFDDFVATDNFDQDNVGQQCVVRNLAESGNPSGTHFLRCPLLLLARRAPIDCFDYPPTPIPAYEFSLPAGGLFAVSLTEDGGSDGTSSTPPTYTYSLADLVNGEGRGANIVPQQQRQNGSFLAAKIGIAVFSGSTALLVWCDEIPSPSDDAGEVLSLA